MTIGERLTYFIGLQEDVQINSNLYTSRTLSSPCYHGPPPFSNNGDINIEKSMRLMGTNEKI